MESHRVSVEKKVEEQDLRDWLRIHTYSDSEMHFLKRELFMFKLAVNSITFTLQ